MSIKHESKIYSATGDGKIPWVSVDDIAAVAFQAVTGEQPPNTDYLILGPELLSYDQVADILTDVIGKKIVHVNVPAAELEARYKSIGIPEDYANLLAVLDTGVKHGAENRTNDIVLSVTGKQPGTFRAFAEGNKAVWL